MPETVWHNKYLWNNNSLVSGFLYNIIFSNTRESMFWDLLSSSKGLASQTSLEKKKKKENYKLRFGGDKLPVSPKRNLSTQPSQINYSSEKLLSFTKLEKKKKIYP